MKFSLLHPSRGRVRMAEQAIGEWIGRSSRRHALEYILSIDADDDDVSAYEQLAAQRAVRLIVNSNRSIVDAANAAARVATGDVFIVVSDDFGCPEAWDQAIATALGERRDVAVLVHDGSDSHIMTLPIVCRAFYEDLGYVLYPEYFHLYCDVDLTDLARRLGKLINARHLVFPHRHYTAGLNAWGCYLRARQ